MGTTLAQAVAMLRGYFRNPNLLDPSVVEEDTVLLTGQLRRIIFGDITAGRLGVADMCQALSDESGDEKIPIIIYCDPENPGTPAAGTASWGFQVPNKMETIKDDGGHYSKLSGVIGKVNNVEPPDGNEPLRSNPPISATFVMSQLLSPANDDTDLLEIFFSAIPTIQWALAQPYLDISIHTVRPGSDSDGQLKGLSLLKFLEGPADVTSAADKMMARENVEILTAAKTRTAGTMAGMELFTSPQTLVPTGPDGNFPPYDSTLRAAPIIDRFRPFMSVDSFKAKLTPVDKGMISTEDATLSLVLHDRSRFAEVAEFSSPEQFGHVTFMIEYGWSHPHGTDPTNPYGMFINALRKKQKYRLVNSSFNFDAVGQAKIDLQLISEGGTEFRDASLEISGGEGVVNYATKLAEAKALITTATKGARKVKLGGKGGTLGTIRKTILKQKFSDVSDIPTLKAENANLIEELKKLKAKVDEAILFDENKEAAAEALADTSKAIGALIDAREGMIEAVTTIADALNKKMIMVGARPSGDPDADTGDLSAEQAAEKAMQDRLGTGPTPDPFLNLTDQYEDGDLEGAPVNRWVISLAKLLLLFVGKPLAATGKFNEVQFVFHVANHHAGAMGITKGGTGGKAPHGHNLGEFPIDVRMFRKVYKSKMQNRMTGNLTLKDFVKMIKSNFTDNDGCDAYGFGNMYNRTWNVKAGKWVVSLVRGMRGKKYRSNFAENLMKATGDDGSSGAYKFKKINLNIEMKCVPRIASDGNLHTMNNLLLIIVTDIAAEGNKDIDKQAMEALGNFTETISGEKDTSGVQDPHVAGEEVDAGDAAKAGSLKGQDLVIQEVLKAIQFGMPVLRYGIEGSVLKTATMSTEMDEALVTSIMQNRKGHGSPSHLTPSGRGQGGVPLQTAPSKFQITCLGCPLVKYGQSYFIDMGTGTTADGVYKAMGFEHSLKAGSFETSFELQHPSSDGIWQSEDVLKAMEAAAKDD